MQPDRAIQLIDRLTAKTEEGELRWSDGVRLNTYQISFPDYSIIIESGPQPKTIISANEYSMRILDEKGNVVANIIDDITAGIMASTLGRLVVENKKMARLFAAAQLSKSRTADRAVEALLERLG